MSTDRIDFFIAGSERSGTTVTGTMLDGMSEICAIQATMVMSRLSNLYDMVKRVLDQGGEFDGIDPVICPNLTDFVTNVPVTPFLHRCYFNFCFYENLVHSSRGDVTKEILSQKAYVQDFDFARYMDRYDPDNPTWENTVTAMYAEFVASAGSNGRIFGEQTPDNGLRIDTIARLFPRARFVFMVRHPITNISSLIDRYTNLDYATRLYRNPFAHFPFDDEAVMEKTIFVRFEDILQHKDETLNSIREHLGLKPLKQSQVKAKHSSKIFSKYVGDSLSMERYYRSLRASTPELRATILQKNNDIADVFYSREESEALIGYQAAA